jgi:hypothetical protein
LTCAQATLDEKVRGHLKTAQLVRVLSSSSFFGYARRVLEISTRFDLSPSSELYSLQNLWHPIKSLN